MGNSNNIYNNGGNVGIGVIPNLIGEQYKLDVGGQVNIRGKFLQIAKDSAGDAGFVKNVPLNTFGYDGRVILGFDAFFGTVELHHQVVGYRGGPNKSNFYTVFNTTEGGVDAGERMLITPSGTVGIGTGTPDSTAILDVSSHSRGGLLPRLTTLQMNSIQTPVSSLTIYNTDSASFAYFNGTEWVFLLDSDIEPWHPAILTNSLFWGGANSTPAFYKDKGKVVHLKGRLLRNPDPIDKLIFTLPVGYRPAETLTLLIAFINSDASFNNYITIESNGEVRIFNYRVEFLSVDGVSFRVQ